MRASYNAAHLVTLAMVGLLPACAPAPLVQGVGLSSYTAMTPSDGLITKSRIHVNKEQVLAAKTITIEPTIFPPSVTPTLSDQQRDLVANAVNRAVCISLSDRFRVVARGESADLTVRIAVTQATETDEIAAGVSAAASLGMNFVNVDVPVPTPRVPIGLGNLSIEAEAIDPSGRQQAAMLWARGATVFFSSPKASKASDAYDLAKSFGDDFGYLLIKGRSPFGSKGFELPDLPSWQRISSTAGFAHKHTACESYGRAPGVAGFVGNKFGLPPEWTDSGAKRAAR